MTMTEQERTAWETWASKNHHRFGSAQMNAYLAGRRDLEASWRRAEEAFDPPVDPALRDAWESLSTEEQLTELRKGEWSGFYPAFKSDPTVWGDCALHGRVVVLAEGRCTHCGVPVHEAKGLVL